MSSSSFTVQVAHRRKSNSLVWSEVDVALAQQGTHVGAPCGRSMAAPRGKRRSLGQIVPLCDDPDMLRNVPTTQCQSQSMVNSPVSAAAGLSCPKDSLIASSHRKLPTAVRNAEEDQVQKLSHRDDPIIEQLNFQNIKSTLSRISLDDARRYSDIPAARAAHLGGSEQSGSQRSVSSLLLEGNSFSQNGAQSPVPLLKKPEANQNKAVRGKFQETVRQAMKRHDKATPWRKDRSKIMSRVVVSRKWAALFGLSGSALLIAQNEGILRGFDPQSDTMNLLKFGAFAASAASVSCIYQVYHMHQAHERLTDHLRHFRTLDTKISHAEIFVLPAFWAEVVLELLVVPPFTTGVFGTWSQDNFVLYSAETIAACLSTCRVYLLWRWYSDHWKAVIPKRFTIESFTKVEFGDAFVVKNLLEGWRAFSTVALVWTASLILFGYWFRSVEATACLLDNHDDDRCRQSAARLWTLDGASYFEKENDLYFQNAVWAMFVTSTTVGYGDIYPTTHFGRFVTLAMALWGCIFAAIMTAALTISVQWTAEEQWVLLLCRKAHGRIVLPQHASKLIGKWWRMRRRKDTRTRQGLSKLRSTFQSAYETQRVDLDKARADVYKVDEMYSRSRYVNSAMRSINLKLKQAYESDFNEAAGTVSSKIEGKRSATTDQKVAQVNPILAQAAQRSNQVLVHDGPGPTAEFDETEFGIPYDRQSSFTSVTRSHNAPRLEPPFDRFPTQSEVEESPVIHSFRKKDACSDHMEFALDLSSKKQSNSSSTISAQSIPSQGSRIAVRTGSLGDSFTTMPQLARARMLADVSRRSFNAEQGGCGLGPQKKILVPDKARKRIEDAVVPRKKAWKRDHVAIHRKLVYTRRILVPLSMLGTACAVVQNELIFANYDPQHVLINLAKGLNSVITILSILAIYRASYLQILLRNVLTHLHELGPIASRVTPWTVVQSKSFWLQIFVMAIHNPPGYSEVFGMYLLSNWILYRSETLFCVWNFTRVFLIWGSIVDWLVSDLPMLHTFAGFASIRIGSSFAIKKALNSWYAIVYIALAWTVSCVLLAYMFRSVEISACLLDNSPHPNCNEAAARHWSIHGTEFDKTNDLFLYNSIWFMFITTTTVGFGDMLPTTHIGRSFAVASTIVGIICTTLLTASTANLLVWTDKETRALTMVKREEARQQREVLAVNIISLWWRLRAGGKKLTRKQRAMNPKQLLRQWQQTKQTASADVSETSDVSSKIDKTKFQIQCIEGQVEKAAKKLWANNAFELMDHHSQWEKSADNDAMAEFWQKQIRRSGNASAISP